MKPRTLAMLMAFASALLVAFWTWSYRSDLMPYPDAMAYRFQAELFAELRLTTAALPERRLLPSTHLILEDGRVYSKYPPGHSLFLVPGVWLGIPAIMPVLATGLTVWLVFLLVREAYGDRVALIATVLAAVSPATIGIGMTMLSEVTSRLVLAFYMLALIRWMKRGGWVSAVAAGLALGYAFNTRPMSALAFGLAGGGFVLYHLIREPRRVAVGLAPAGVAFALFLAAYLGWNALHTGDPLQPTFNYQATGDRPGFGPRWETFNRGDGPIIDHTPRAALYRTWWTVLPCLAHVSLGWGTFSHNMHYYWREAEVVRSYLVFALVYALMLLPLFMRTRGGYGGLFLGVFVADIVCYSLHFFDQISFSPTPFGARYHNEATVLAMLPLIARGLDASGVWLARDPVWRPVKAVVAASLILFAANATGRSLSRHAWLMIETVDEAKRLIPRIVKERGLTNAVVYLDRGLGVYLATPVGEYPRQALERADVVYCLTGELGYLGLPDESWQSLHRRLFPDREPWMAVRGPDGPRLVRLDPEARE